MENLTFAGESGNPLSRGEIREFPQDPKAPQDAGASQKPLSQAPLAAGVEVGRRIPGGTDMCRPRVNEGAASPNPIRGGASEGRKSGDLLLTWLNLELALELGLIDRERVQAFAAGLTEDEAERLLAWLWAWSARHYGRIAA